MEGGMGPDPMGHAQSGAAWVTGSIKRGCLRVTVTHNGPAICGGAITGILIGDATIRGRPGARTPLRVAEGGRFELPIPLRV